MYIIDVSESSKGHTIKNINLSHCRSHARCMWQQQHWYITYLLA